MSEEKLTPKQEIFISEYLLDFNATRAAKEAGYSEATARQIGCELLTKPNIKEAIENHIKLVVGNKNKIIIQNINFWVGVRDDAEATYSERLKASEHLGKYAEMFKDKVELTVNTEAYDKLKELYDGK